MYHEDDYDRDDPYFDDEAGDDWQEFLEHREEELRDRAFERGGDDGIRPRDVESPS